jgi:GNAT superfamily N-acetyltransferase
VTAPLILRPGEPEDRSVVADSWSRTFAAYEPRCAQCGTKDKASAPKGDTWIRHGSGWIAPNLHYEGERHIIDELLERAGLIVGHLDDAPDVVVSWCVFELLSEGLTVHYVWTRPEFQRRGYGRQLLAMAREVAGPNGRLRCSHMTHAGERLIRAYRKDVRAQAHATVAP